MSAALEQQLDAIASALQPDEGVQATVLGPGIAWSAARGTPAGGQFRVASVTKAFVACAVLRLCEAGRVGLRQPVATVLPTDLADQLDARIRLVDLLGHTSGLADHSSADTFRTAVLADPGRRWTPQEQLQIALALPRSGPPGSTFLYSDTGYVVLGSVLETITGRSLAEAVRSSCELDRLGLRDTWWEVLEESRAGTRSPQRFLDLDLATLSPTVDLYGGGGLVSTTLDLARFCRALLAGELLGRPLLATMLRPGPPAQEGLGLFRLPGGLWGHTGFWGTAMAGTEDGLWSVAVATTRTPGFGGTDPTPIPAALLAAATGRDAEA